MAKRKPEKKITRGSKKTEGFSTRSVHFFRRQKEDAIPRNPSDAINPVVGVSPALDHSVTFSHAGRTETLIDAFQGKQKSFTYSRNASPSGEALEQFITAMEGGIESSCFATGMAAIANPFVALLRQGDHILASRYLFGNTLSLFGSFRRLGFEVDFSDFTDAQQVSADIKPNTRFFFFETIANPKTQVADVEGISKLANKKDIISIVDNTITTPLYFEPKAYGFTFAHHSLSKYIAGHAEVLAGSITDLGNKNWDEDPNILSIYKKRSCLSSGMLQIKKKGMRDMGAVVSPESVARVLSGAMTLPLRMKQHEHNAGRVAAYLANHPLVQHVYYPGLKNHPQHGIARAHFKGFSAILSFVLSDACDMNAFLNALEVIIPATHLGDLRTLIIPVSQTIFFELGEKGREEAGLEENLIRMSIGIEDCDDLIADLDGAFATSKR